MREVIMKKIVSYFLALCTVVTVQFFRENIASAKPAIKSSNTSVSPVEKNSNFTIPMILKLEQTALNQIEITYDRDVDMGQAMKLTNYWIQDTMYAKPKGIATLGKNDKMNVGNSLAINKNRVSILSKRGSTKTFIISFNKYIPIGVEYKLTISNVKVEGAPPYSGDNGTAIFVGK
jgi:hypothetical protein